MPRWTALPCILALAATAQQVPPEPTFRAGTRLVQVSVVAQDKDGKPVTDLRREDFQIFDNAAPQEIRLFLADQPAPAPTRARTPGVFTNQLATEGRGGYSVLLFDNLNVDPARTVFAYTARARQKALLAMEEISPNDKIAIYALGCRFQVVREFTSDRDSLLRQLKAFGPAPGPCADPSSGEPPPRPTFAQLMVSGPTRADGTPMMGPSMALPAGNGGHAAEGMGDASAAIAAGIADKEVLALAEHLAGIPGRKNLIWLTTVFYVRPANLQRLINADVAIYPVDTLGSAIGLPADKAARAAPLRALAAQTGGVAYADRDDLDVAIREALSDGRISYTLGFYQPDEVSSHDKHPPVHRLAVRVSRPNVALRYRTSYVVEPPPPRSPDPIRDFVLAMNRPVDATGITLSASAMRTKDRLDLSLSFDISGLDLRPTDGRWRGKTEIVARFVTATGIQVGATRAETVTFNLLPASYTGLLEKGVPYRRQLTIPPKADELKVLVGSLASGKIGTLTVPLSDVGASRTP